MGKTRIPPPLYHLSLSFAAAALVDLVPALAGLVLFRESVGASLALYSIVLLAPALLLRTVLAPSRPMRLEDAVVAAAATWILVPILAALPVALAMNIPFVDAWFESVSGFTTTGLTVFSGGVDPEYAVYLPSASELPKTIQLWRSFMQWIGGIGILVLFVAFAAGGGLPPHLIGLVEGRYEHLEPSIARSVRAFILVYVVLTATAVILFIVTGMPLYDAVNHAMTGIATGGFSVRDESLAYYQSLGIELAAVVVMFLGALNFADHYYFLRGDARRLLTNPETHILVTVVSLLVAAGALTLLYYGYGLAESLRVSLFQYVSAVTGTGFQTMDLGAAPEPYKLLLGFASLLGGSVISTTGGIKMFRLLIAVNSVKWVYQELVSEPIRVVSRRIGGKSVGLREVHQALAIIFLFTLTWLIGGALVALFSGASLADALFEAASALGNVGLSTGIASATANTATKAVLIVLMALGRLEIIVYVMAIMAARAEAKLWLARRRRGSRPERRLLQPQLRRRAAFQHY